MRCARFERVWSSAAEAADGAGGAVETDAVAGERGVTVWRPQAPAGYAPLGDCITAGARQPSFQARDDVASRRFHWAGQSRRHWRAWLSWTDCPCCMHVRCKGDLLCRQCCMQW